MSRMTKAEISANRSRVRRATAPNCRNAPPVNGRTTLFRELRSRYKASTAPELVTLWQLHRKVMPRYGLGRFELLPIRKCKEAISEYIGKYLEAGLIIRKHSWKGCRRVEFDRRNKILWLACTRIFAWHSPGAITWRAHVGELARALGVRVVVRGDLACVCFHMRRAGNSFWPRHVAK